MRALSAKLSQRIQAALLECGPFGSSNELQAVFNDARIAAWRYRLPEASSAAGRVEITIDFLQRRENERGESGLVLLLRVLGERLPPGDSCHERLLGLADAVAAEKRLEPEAAASPTVHQAGATEIPIELTEQMAAGEVGLFVGHRLSEAAGLPSRGDLACAMAERMGEPLPGEAGSLGQHLPDVAQLYEVAQGRHALLSYLRDQLDSTLLQPALLHELVARLPVHTIFSTAYDDLLERALRQAGRRVNRVTGDSMLPHASADRVQLLKLKGDIDMPQTVVVTRSDLDQYAAQHPLIVNQLRDRLSSTTFLLLGYDADDADLKLLFEQGGYQAGVGRLQYAPLIGVSALQKQVLRQRQIRVVDIAPDGLSGWLDTLVAEAERVAG